MQKYTYALLLALIGLSGLVLSGCQKTQIVTATTNDVNIYDYLKRHDSLFSN